MNIPKKFSTNSLITLHWDDEIRKGFYNIAKKYNYGIEVSSFAHFSIWDNPKKYLEIYKRELEGFSNYISFHGPISEIIPHADDPDIFKTIKDKVQMSIEYALILNSKRIVFHTGINTVVTDPKWISHIIEKQSNFWQKMACSYPSIEVVLENMWEKDTGYIKSIIVNANCTNLNACLDFAHAHVYGKITLEKWIHDYGKYLKHIHLNDNHGIFDEHLSLGEGTINWEILNNKELDHNNLKFVYELDSIEKIEKSVEKVKIVTT